MHVIRAIKIEIVRMPLKRYMAPSALSAISTNIRSLLYVLILIVFASILFLAAAEHLRSSDVASIEFQL